MNILEQMNPILNYNNRNGNHKQVPILAHNYIENSAMYIAKFLFK